MASAAALSPTHLYLDAFLRKDYFECLSTQIIEALFDAWIASGK